MREAGSETEPVPFGGIACHASCHAALQSMTDPAEIMRLEAALLARLRQGLASDSAHDLGHLSRVLRMARRIAAREGAHDPLVLTAAALLHDMVSVPKDHPDRSCASSLAAAAAAELLEELGMQPARVAAVAHAILARSFSAGVEPLTPEARAVQDADRLDALGAIGVARCFAVSGALGRALADPEDPLAEHRPLDDARWVLDHFQTKLLRLPDTMRTVAGRHLAVERAAFLRDFMQRFAAESLADQETDPQF